MMIALERISSVDIIDTAAAAVAIVGTITAVIDQFFSRFNISLGITSDITERQSERESRRLLSAHIHGS